MARIVLSTGRYFLLGFRLVLGEDLNKLIDEINGLTVPGAVTMKQMRQALVNVSTATMYSVSDVIPADVADPVNIQWLSGGIVAPSDTLAVLIQSTLGYSDLQMTVLFQAAALLPP